MTQFLEGPPFNKKEGGGGGRMFQLCCFCPEKVTQNICMLLVTTFKIPLFLMKKVPEQIAAFDYYKYAFYVFPS